jgi:hypothetical protein
MWRRSGDNEELLQVFFEDLPPEALLRHMNKKVLLDPDELERATWFWKRRPNRLSSIPNIFMALTLCLIFYILLIYFYQQITTSPFGGVILSIFFGALIVAYVHVYQYAQWKSEYGRAILRLLRLDAR